MTFAGKRRWAMAFRRFFVYLDGDGSRRREWGIMKLKTLFAATAATSLAVAPVALNAESFDRNAAPVSGASELEGEN